MIPHTIVQLTPVVDSLHGGGGHLGQAEYHGVGCIHFLSLKIGQISSLIIR